MRARRRASSTSRTWARSRRAAPDAEAFLQRLLSNDVRQHPRGRRAVQRALPRGRRRARRPLHLPAGRPPLPHGHQRRQPREGPRLVPAPTRGDFDVDVVDARRRLRDARRPGADGARRSSSGLADGRAAAADARLRAHRRRRRDCSSAAPATPARTASSCCSPRATPPRSGTRCSAAGATPCRPRRARHPAPRGLLPPLRQRPLRGPRPDRGRPRLVLQGGHRLHRRPRRSAPPAPPGRPRRSSPFRLTGSGHRPPGQPGRRRRRGRPAARSRPAWASASAWPTCPAARADAGHAARDRRARQGPRRAMVEDKPLYRKDSRDAMADASYPDDLLYHPEHDWARIEGDEATFGITWYAQDALGEVVFFDPPEVGRDASTKDEPYAEVESVKAVSDVIAPLSGRDRRGQRGARRRARSRSTTTPTAPAGWSRCGCPTRRSATRCWTPPPTRRSLE